MTYKNRVWLELFCPPDVQRSALIDAGLHRRACSGDPMAIAEVVRDLHRAGGQPEQSYSERQLYEAALARMARELAAVERIDEQAAVKRVEGALLKKAA